MLRPASTRPAGEALGRPLSKLPRGPICPCDGSGPWLSGCGAACRTRPAEGILRSCLQELGWAIGRNVQIDYRWGPGDTGLYRTHAAELMALAPDVILVSGASAAGRRTRAPVSEGSDFAAGALLWGEACEQQPATALPLLTLTKSPGNICAAQTGRSQGTNVFGDSATLTSNHSALIRCMVPVPTAWW